MFEHMKKISLPSLCSSRKKNLDQDVWKVVKSFQRIAGSPIFLGHADLPQASFFPVLSSSMGFSDCFRPCYFQQDVFGASKTWIISKIRHFWLHWKSYLFWISDDSQRNYPYCQTKYVSVCSLCTLKWVLNLHCNLLAQQLASSRIIFILSGRASCCYDVSKPAISTMSSTLALTE